MGDKIEELKQSQEEFQGDVVKLIGQIREDIADVKKEQSISMKKPDGCPEHICQIEVMSNKKDVSPQELAITSREIAKEMRLLMEKYKVSQIRAILTFAYENEKKPEEPIKS